MLYVVGVTHPLDGGWMTAYVVGGVAAVLETVAALRIARHLAGAEVAAAGAAWELELEDWDAEGEAKAAKK